MQASLIFFLRAQYRRAGLADGFTGDAAFDASPVDGLSAELKRLTRRWQDTFNELSGSLSAELAQRTLKTSDATLKGGLKKRGLAIKFKMSPEMRDAYQAVVGEQVGLIKSIAAEHLTDVEGIVMRAVQRGRDAGELTKQLETRYSLTRNRAALIARDQTAKATSSLQSARQRGLGIEEGIWKHSHAGKQPRPSHMKADGKKFRLDTGLYLDGEWVMPGEAINCRCTWSPVLPGLD